MKSYGNVTESGIRHGHFSLFFFDFSLNIHSTEHIAMLDI